MKHIISFLLLSLIMYSCGINYHLKRSQYHKRMAIAKGADIKEESDTVIIKKEYVFPEFIGDTTFNYRDTTEFKYEVRVDTMTRTRVIFRVDTLLKEVYVKVEFPADTVECEDRIITVTEEIVSKPRINLWHGMGIITAIAVLLGGIALSIHWFTWTRRKRRENL